MVSMMHTMHTMHTHHPPLTVGSHSTGTWCRTRRPGLVRV
jgi:hypothetical protein